MSQPRETTTNNLADVIQVIQIGHRSGTLTVERGEGNAYEEGEIVFANGQIVNAQTGTQSGPVALGWLTTWTNCRFAFNVESSTTTPRPPFQPSGHSPLSTRPGSSPARTNTNSSGNFRPITTASMYGQNTPRTASTPSMPNQFVTQIPYRIRTDNSVLAYIEQVGLTREHRRLFMLIDGQRTTHELVGLMGKNLDKIVELLNELERAGIVHHR
ncbi:DUF4388 domain-containing protein [Dictyobacter arantiisoli]|uniref:PatA-like N-terminal domain-containing protein n=1 Tax=Dictyobacter arantiisoli TaxID=2014874 RepID=A0A5A5TFC5_9CHLR|nr:DUF4388 domain-containing protein [Dictyobacter arantiisoli]GCF09938.1 hypothetical protein KDI_35020 [Dictyobacter arantiisoli]